MRSLVPALSLVSLVTASLLTASLAEAHVSIVSGPAASSKSQKITFGVGHGCGALDTTKIRVEIPAGISGVRPLASDFGKPIVEKTGNNVIAVTWEKPEGNRQTDDVEYHELTLRARVDAKPFSVVYFRVIQTCTPAVGDDVVVDWIATTPGAEGEPAAELLVTPARTPGWNKYTLDATTTVAGNELAKYLGDALIVWRGNAAYSSNANTAAMIATTPGVTALTGDLRPNDVLWVKY
jgi:periplasmic copper chaperone A